MGQSITFQKNPRLSHKIDHPKTLIIHLGQSQLQVQVSDSNLTTGWLLSEVIRRQENRRNISALKTARGLEILDMWLTIYDRNLRPFDDKEHLVAVFQESVPQTLCLGHFQPLKLIGKGAFSRVILARKRDTGALYAIKTISKDFVMKEQKVAQIINEKNILAKVNSPFIVNLYWLIQTQRDLHIVLDFCPGGELFFHLQNIGRLNENQARFYFSEILIGLEYLHDLKIVYRDLKPQNILLDIDGHIKITDFGLSKEMKNSRERSYSFCGSPEYMSPEMLRKQGHGREVDFYSLGALLYEMLTGLPPFYHNDRTEMYARILQKPLHLPSYLSKSAKSLIMGLLQKNARRRLGSFDGIREIKRHVWLEGINWDLVKGRTYRPPFKPTFSASNFDPEYTRESVGSSDFEFGLIYEPADDDPFFEFTQIPLHQGQTLSADKAAHQNSPSIEAHRRKIQYQKSKRPSLQGPVQICQDWPLKERTSILSLERVGFEDSLEFSECEGESPPRESLFHRVREPQLFQFWLLECQMGLFCRRILVLNNQLAILIMIKSKQTIETISTLLLTKEPSVIGESKKQKIRSTLALQLETLNKEQAQLTEYIKKTDVHTLRMENEYKAVLAYYQDRIQSQNWDSGEKIMSYFNEICNKLEVIISKTQQLMDHQEREIVQEYNSTFNNLFNELFQTKEHHNKNLMDAQMKQNALLTQKQSKEKEFIALFTENEALVAKNRDLKLREREYGSDILRKTQNLKDIRRQNEKLQERIERAKMRKSISLPILVKTTPHTVNNFVENNADPILEWKKQIFRVKQQQIKVKNMLKTELERKQQLKESIKQNSTRVSQEINHNDSVRLRKKQRIYHVLMESIVFPGLKKKTQRSEKSEVIQEGVLESLIQKIEKVYTNYENSLKGNIEAEVEQLNY